MTNHQCYCYGIIALEMLLLNNYEICSGNFYNALYDLWDRFSEEAIEEYYEYLFNAGKIV